MALTAKSMPYKSGFGPFAAEVYRAPDVVPVPRRAERGGCRQDGASRIIEKQIGADNLAAVIIEPIQGEGGFIVPADGFLPAMRRRGAARTASSSSPTRCRPASPAPARMFASELFGIVPDLITTAKGIAGGLPLAAVTGRAEIMDASHAGGLGGTYGGNPIACAAALAAIDVFENDGMIERAHARSATILTARLDADAATDPRIGDIRGRGAMIAAEFVDPATGEPDAALTARGRKGLHRRGRDRAHLRHVRQRHPLPAAPVDLRRTAQRGPRRRRSGARRARESSRAANRDGASRILRGHRNPPHSSNKGAADGRDHP